jgi:LPS-assembly lipoprotein
MWWSDRAPKLAIVAAVLATGLGGCVFRPLYADPQVVAAVSPEAGAIGRNLADIVIAPVADRSGVVLRNELIFVLTGTGRATETGRYRLDATISRSAGPAIVEPVSGRPQAASVLVTIAYSLVDTQSGSVVFTGRVGSRANYDSTTQLFANTRAAREAEDRALKEAAVMIRNGLAGHFARGAAGG